MDYLAVVFAIGLLVFGALNTLATKATFQIQAVNLNGQLESFQKPWFGVYRMFQGMAFVIFLHAFQEIRNYSARKRQVASSNYLPIDENGVAAPAAPAAAFTPFKSYLIVAIPAALDLFGTTCTYVGLFYNSPSVWQMFRGAMVIFATFFSVTVLKRPMNTVKWLGIGIVVLAITVVGVANTLSASTQVGSVQIDESLKFFGMGMILLGMLMQGAQVVVEEFMMKGLDAPPLMVVGMEGVWGCVIMLGLVFPVVTHLPGSDVGGVQENLENDIAMVHNSPPLQAMIGVYLFSVFTFNIVGMMVTYRLSAVHRTLLEASRTAVIWGIDLWIHYLHPTSQFGESWNQFSYLQLVGFLLLVMGQATYGELITWGIRVPPKKTGIPTPTPSPFREPGMLFSPAAAASAASPGSGRSPMFSPKGQLDMGLDLPASDEDGCLDLTGLEEEITKA